MKIAIIGTNGLLSNSLGQFCNMHNIKVDTYGLFPPEQHKYDNFYQLNLLNEELPLDNVCQADIIIFAVGAGIQSNLKESSDLIYALNVTTPIKICNALKNAKFSGVFVSFGSYFEIGENIENIFFSEKELLISQRRVFNDYSISKRLFSRFISSVEMPYKTWHFILPTIYGEKESSHRLIPYTLNSLKKNMKIEFTSGDQIRQYIYIDEISQIIKNAFDTNLSSGVYNVAGTETLSVKELVNSLFKAFNKQLPDSVFGKVKRQDTGMKTLQLDGQKLQEAIAFKPSIKILDIYDRY